MSSDPIESHYEKPHLRGRPFVIGIIVFFVIITLIFTVIWNLLGAWSREPWPHRAPPAPPTARAGWNTQAPLVQIDPTMDLLHLQQVENQRLHTLRWTDGSHAYAAIPIEEAMKILAEAAAENRLNTILPPPQPATPIDLQNQKSREVSPPQLPNP